MFKFVKNMADKFQPVKAVVPESFQKNLTQLSVSREKATQEKKETGYDELLERAISNLKDYISSTALNESDFRKVITDFSKACELRPSKPEPYFYLAYMFYLASDSVKAIKYLKAVSLINPEYPNLEILREDILNSIESKDVIDLDELYKQQEEELQEELDTELNSTIEFFSKMPIKEVKTISAEQAKAEIKATSILSKPNPQIKPKLNSLLSQKAKPLASIAKR